MTDTLRAIQVRTRKSVARALARLRREMPTKHRVKVTWIDSEGCFGSCELRGRGKRRWFDVRLDPKRCAVGEVAIETLLHEWAHCRTWFDLPMHDHGDLWGVAYAQVYRKFWRTK